MIYSKRFKSFIASFLFLLSVTTFSQEELSKDIDRNTGYFNITGFSVKSIFSAKQETFDTTNGVVVTTLNSDNANAFGITTINGYFINKNISLGIGVGLQRYNNPGANTLPLFFDARYYFSEEANSLYIVGNAGALLKIENGTKRGSMARIGIGLKYPISNKSRTMLVTDISLSHRSISQDGKSISDSENFLILNGAIINFGIIF